MGVGEQLAVSLVVRVDAGQHVSKQPSQRVHVRSGVGLCESELLWGSETVGAQCRGVVRRIRRDGPGDAEVDQMVLQFPIMADYCAIADGDTLIYATHGHTYNEQNLPPLHRGDILLHGHTHVPACVPHDTYTCMNPGSVAIPKAGSWHGYMIMENGRFQWKTMTNEVKMEFADGKRIL